MSNLEDLQNQMRHRTTRQPISYPKRNVYHSIPTTTNGEGIAGMVLGIVAIALMCVPFLPLILGIPGLVLSGIGMKKPNKGMAVAGLVLNIIVLFLQFLMVLGMFSNPMLLRQWMKM